MTKKEQIEDLEDIDLEDLLAQTEQKIMNNEYYEDVSVKYKNANVHLRIQPISQERLNKLTENKKSRDTADFNAKLIHECVLNKKDNKPFTLDQINKLFAGGLAVIVSAKCAEVSGLPVDELISEKLLHF